MAKVHSIQVCGLDYYNNLEDACLDYVNHSINETPDSPPMKIHFAIDLDDGTTKSITFRHEGKTLHVYGDFEGIPDFLEWSKLYVNK